MVMIGFTLDSEGKKQLAVHHVTAKVSARLAPTHAQYARLNLCRLVRSYRHGIVEPVV